MVSDQNREMASLNLQIKTMKYLVRGVHLPDGANRQETA